MTIINEENNKTIHKWLCSETPGYYICRCGATGEWNRILEKVEVLEPAPEAVYRRRHKTDE